MTTSTVNVIATNGEINFWLIGDQVYRARTSDLIDVNGLPQASRWECSHAHFTQFRSTVFSWVKDVKR